jgi:hypothetical protein
VWWLVIDTLEHYYTFVVVATPLTLIEQKCSLRPHGVMASIHC